MLYTLRGGLVSKGENFFVLQCGGIGFRVSTNKRTLAHLPQNGDITVYTFMYIREERVELYGFLEEQALKLFELLNMVAGVGPKTALGILDIDVVPNIMAAIFERRADLLTHASGIGRKTAERIILELENKIKMTHVTASTKEADVNRDVETILAELGYARHEVRAVMQAQGVVGKTVEEKLKSALKELGRPR